MFYVQVREKERIVEQLQEAIELEESIHKHEENLQLCQVCMGAFIFLYIYTHRITQKSFRWVLFKGVIECKTEFTLS